MLNEEDDLVRVLHYTQGVFATDMSLANKKSDENSVGLPMSGLEVSASMYQMYQTWHLK